MNTSTALILAGLAAAASCSGFAAAQDAKNQGYLVDTYGNGITTSSNTGLCVRDSDWTPARAVEPCDPVARKAELPAPVVAAAPEPAPVPAPVAPAAAAPVMPVPQKIHFSADALFDFDQSVLKPAGRTMLDQLARDLKGASYTSILAVGHTDRIGSAAYNQSLSQRRATAVKDHLVTQGIAARQVTAEGKGETVPVTRPGDCPGAKSARVIACLQPDRRVDVEVNGTRAPTVAR